MVCTLPMEQSPVMSPESDSPEKTATSQVRCVISSRARRRPPSAPPCLGSLPSHMGAESRPGTIGLSMSPNGSDTKAGRLGVKLRLRSSVFSSRPKSAALVRDHAPHNDTLQTDAERWTHAPGHVQFDKTCSREQRERRWATYLASNPGDSPVLEDPCASERWNHIPGFRFDGQSGRTAGHCSYLQPKDSSEVPLRWVSQPFSSGGCFPSMDKLSSREQRARGMGHFHQDSPADLPLYDSQPVALHMPGVDMERLTGRYAALKTPSPAPASRRRAEEGSSSPSPSPAVGSPGSPGTAGRGGQEADPGKLGLRATAPNPKLVLSFGSYPDRSRPSSSMRRFLRVKTRDLDLSLYPKEELTLRHQGPPVNMSKQISREKATKTLRVNPHRVPDEAVLPLQPKYTVLEPSPARVVSFQRMLSRYSDARTRSERAAREQTSHLDVYPVEAALDLTRKSRVPGFSMEKQLSRERVRRCQPQPRAAYEPGGASGCAAPPG
eukprot:RCo041101